jgi:glycosyltransferase involved in cell wall biosynthesis
MKILHTVEFYSPSVGGAQEVVKQLSEHLVMLGHDVTVATTKLPSRKKKVMNGVKIVEFDVSGNEVRGYSGKDIRKYQEFLIKGKFDVIMNYAAQEWTADLAFRVITKIKAKKIFVPCGYSGLYDPSYHDYFAKLPAILRQYDRCVYLSEDYRDINFAKELKLKNSVIIPNGADEREFRKLPNQDRNALLRKYGIPENNKILLCVSNHTGQKGHQESIRSFNRSNIKNTSLVFIGDINHYGGCYKSCVKSSQISRIKNLILRNGKTIHVLHLSRTETLKFFAACDIFLFLSNIECSPLVLFESAAAGKPFISSGCGNAVEIAKWTKSGIIVKSQQKKDGYTSIDIDSSAKAIEELLSNNNLQAKLGKSGRTNWGKHYTWEVIAKRYIEIYLGAG